MPEAPTTHDLHSPPPRRLPELLDSRLASAGEKERLVELALPGQLGFPQRQAGILSDFPSAHLVEANDGQSGLRSKLLEGGDDLGVWPGEREAVVTAGAPGALERQVEIALRDEDPAAVFGDERVAAAELPTEDLELGAGLAGDKNQGHASAFDFLKGFLGRRPGIGLVVEQRAVQIRKDQVTRRHHG